MGYWVARKSIKIKRGKGYVDLKGGDPVPEAAFWPTKGACERMGMIQWIKGSMPEEPVKAEELPSREAFPRSQTGRNQKYSEKKKIAKKNAERDKEVEKKPAPRKRGRPKKTASE